MYHAFPHVSVKLFVNSDSIHHPRPSSHTYISVRSTSAWRNSYEGSHSADALKSQMVRVRNPQISLHIKPISEHDAAEVKAN